MKTNRGICISNRNCIMRRKPGSIKWDYRPFHINGVFGLTFFFFQYAHALHIYISLRTHLVDFTLIGTENPVNKLKDHHYENTYVNKLILSICLYKKFVPCNQGSQGWGAGAGCIWLLRAGAAWKKNQEPEPLGKNIRSRSRLKKKIGSRSRKKICRLPSPDLKKHVI